MNNIINSINNEKDILTKLSFIVENSLSPIYITNPDGTIEWVNNGFLLLTGYTKDDVIGKISWDILRGEDTETKTCNYISQQINRSKPYSCDILNYTKDGATHWVRTSGQPLFDEKGNLSQYLITQIDITEEKNTKNLLSIETEKYNNIIANMNLGFVEIDTQGVITFTNSSFCDNLGYKQSELLHKDASLFLDPESITTYQEYFSKRHDGTSNSYELKVKHKNGTKPIWLISAAPKYNANKEFAGSVAICLDITRQKFLESQKEDLLRNLSEQNEQLNEYAHIVAHDLKSPLRAVYALLSWTIEDFREKFDHNSLLNLNLMQDKVEKMDHLIDSILKYSSIERGVVVNEDIDLNILVKNVVDMVYCPDNININIEPNFPTIVANETRVQQLFQNLLSNAVNYTDKEEGNINIGWTENDTHFIFSIKDNGIGIAKEDQHKIFDIFSSLGKHKRSTGVGLNIVKKVVDMYQGEIWLESEVSIGTTFFFSIKK